jgi:ketosteroid isomerase-like protein
MNYQLIEDLAERLFAAFEANDSVTLESCCHPAARFWKNGVESGTLPELLPTWATLSTRIGHHRYTEVRRSIFDGGFVEEHRVLSTMPDGTALDVVACVVATVDSHGQITELREYVNSPLSAPRSGLGAEEQS